MFKLIDIEFVDHPFFGSLKVDFTSPGEGWAKHYITLLIGPNGTGKSKILLSIIGIFNSLENISKNPNKKYSFEYHYRIKFGNKGKLHKVDYSTDDLIIDDSSYKNNVEYLSLPAKLLISAFSFNDKYPLRESRGKVINENYYYLGLKSTTNNIFIGNPTKNAISNLYEAIIKGKDIAPLSAAFTTLQLKPELKLVYKPGKYFKFLQSNELWRSRDASPHVWVNGFSDFFRKKKAKRKNAEPELKRLGNEKVERILNETEKIQKVIEFLNEKGSAMAELEGKEISLKPSLNFHERDSFDEFTQTVLPFQLLSDLEIISFQRFEIKKIETNFSFDDASSGEYHIILTYLNILSLLEDSSLVLLDEPEISLHPNWQIKYMDAFNKVFHHFPKTHFIIASHSHFLVSDLKGDHSSILGIDVNEKGEIKIIPTERDTYGWSAEQILLDVFKVATTRNYYLTRVVGNILHNLSQKDFNKQTIVDEIEKLKQYDIDNLNENDPMKLVIKKLLAKVDK